MSDVTVRKARADEYAAVGELTVAAYAADGYFEDVSMDGYAAELAAAEDRAKDSDVLVAVAADGALLGTLTVIRPGARGAELVREGELEIRMLAVSPAVRGRGVAKELTRAVLRMAAEQGCARVVLCSVADRVKVHALYAREGFQRIPDRDWRPEPDLLLLGFAAEIQT
jgi:ribosomal protein S18 acetylase RimI-like enzyme